jgi:two-component system, LytTR family, response regulator
MNIRAIIVDDDSYAIESLKVLLEKIPDVELLRVFTNPKESIAYIRDEKPDLVFLDIRMPEMSGFELLDQIEHETLEVIFVTGYNQYAINALRYSALDYLLKPVTLHDLTMSLERYHQRTERIMIQSRLLNLRKNLSRKEEDFELVLLTKSEGEKKFRGADIIRCEADSNYAIIHATSDRRFTASKTLSDLESMLASNRFIRIHKSHLVNKRFVRSLNRNLEMIMQDGTVLPVSKRRIEEVRRMLM